MTMEGGSSDSLLIHLIGVAILIAVASSKCITLEESDPANFSVKFIGNDDPGQYYSYVYYKNGMLFLGSSDTIYKVDPDSFTQIWALDISSVRIREDTLTCEEFTADHLELVHCKNQISLIERIDSSWWLVCGTNAKQPACWNCTGPSTEPWSCSLTEFNRVDRFIPHTPDHDSTWIYNETSNKAFTGTEVPSHQMAYFQELDAASDFDTELSTNHNQENLLNTPAFVGDPIEHEGYIYFFFREVATEYVNAGKIVYSRVGRVCANDVANRHSSFQGYFQTMVKARLNCSIDLTFPFYFNEIQDTFISPSGDDQIIYAVFTTPGSGPPASAVCAYSLAEIESLFNDHARYKGQDSIGDDWLPKPHTSSSLGSSPERFGKCGVQYTDTPARRDAVNNYNLVDQLVPNLRNVKKTSVNPLRDSDSPILYLNNYRFTSIAKVAEGSGGGPIVLMIGTDNGRILKTSFSPDMGDGVYGNKIAEIMLNSERPDVCQVIPCEVRDLVVLDQEEGGTYIIATAVSDAFKVNVEFCNIYKTCEDCRRVMDPHCSWDENKNTCSSNGELQSVIPPVTSCRVFGGSDNIDEIKSFGTGQPASKNASHPVNEYSLIVAKKGSKVRVDPPKQVDTKWIHTIESGATPETEFYAVRLEGDSAAVDKEVVFSIFLDDEEYSNITAAVTEDRSETCQEKQAGEIFRYDCELAKYEFKMAKIRQDMLKKCAAGDNAGGVYQCPSARFEGDSDSYTCPAI